MQRIEDAAIERHQRDQQQIGKCDPGQIDGDGEAAIEAAATLRERRPNWWVEASAVQF